MSPSSRSTLSLTCCHVAPSAQCSARPLSLASTKGAWSTPLATWSSTSVSHLGSRPSRLRYSASEAGRVHSTLLWRRRESLRISAQANPASSFEVSMKISDPVTHVAIHSSFSALICAATRPRGLSSKVLSSRAPISQSTLTRPSNSFTTLSYDSAFFSRPSILLRDPLLASASETSSVCAMIPVTVSSKEYRHEASSSFSCALNRSSNLWPRAPSHSSISCRPSPPSKSKYDSLSASSSLRISVSFLLSPRIALSVSWSTPTKARVSPQPFLRTSTCSLCAAEKKPWLDLFHLRSPEASAAVP
mmetsp:Transcript_4391/g.15753  ORF Transcript_4391/g.15753 Transcript_4391/m.15753 type:complete len:304 (-) Transcript_4391:2013-2924(-)